MAIGVHAQRALDESRRRVTAKIVASQGARRFAAFEGLNDFMEAQRRRIGTSLGHDTRRAKRRDDRWHLESRGVETKHFELERAPTVTGSTLAAAEE
jgi:hypothetical protein